MSSRSIMLVTVVFVLGLAQAGLAQVDPNLIGWWRLDEGRGTTAADLSRYGNQGTFVSAPKWVAGKIGSALQFDGTDDYVRCAERVGAKPGTYPAELMPATFTVACWTKLDNFAFFSSFVGNGIDTGDDECGFFLYNYGWIDESGKDFGLAIRTETAMNYVETPNVYETNTWYHIAATYDGTNVNIYVNGSLAVGPTNVGGPMRWISQTSGNYPERFSIGVWLDPGYDLWVDGAIDDVRYYSRALDAGEVKALMTATGYYPFAYGPVPKHGAMIKATSQVLQWSPGDSAALHEVYFGQSFEQIAAATPADTSVFAGKLTARTLAVGTTSGLYPKGLVPGATYYWRVDEVNDVHPGSPWKGEVWSFSVQPLTAWKPYPPDGIKNVDPNQDLSWESGMNAMIHTVYLGRSFDEVSKATAGGRVTANSPYDPGPLAMDTTYYWRVDEFAVPGNVTRKGPVWSFSTRGPGGGVKAQYFNGKSPGGTPVVTRIESSIDHSWPGEIVAGLMDNVSARWTADLEVPFTETYSLITTSDDGVRLWLDGRLIVDNWTDHATTSNVAKVDLIAGQIYSIRMEYYDSEGAAVAQLSWQSPTLPRQIIPQGWLQLPLWATSPSPANGEAHAPQTPMLRWSEGDEATDHDVYFGADAGAVAAATPAEAGVYCGRQNLDAVTYDPGPLEWNKMYYWRVDEVNATNPDSPWKGRVWSFTTADFIVIDDFEVYTNDSPNRLFQTWVDGLGYSIDQYFPSGNPGNGTGAAVGHDIWNSQSAYYGGSIVETQDVHGGYQAMPLYYDNTAAPYYSQAERTWKTAQNWTANGVIDLTLYVRGKADNSPAPLNVAVEDSAGRVGVVTHPDGAIVTAKGWAEWKIPLSSFTNAGVTLTTVKKMYISVGGKAFTAGGTGVVYIDDIRLTKPEGVVAP
jgi:hypothetical protein